MMIRRFLAISSLTGLVIAAINDGYHNTCGTVQTVLSKASSVYYPGDPLYAEGKYHFVASSDDNPACVVEPGTPEDLGKVLKVIGANKTPFAVKSGGHTINLGFSSTKGVLIYTGRFSQVTYDATSGTVVVGTGLIWDTVYEQLQNYGVTVVGGRVTGVGVGGLVLGGGYSYKTNQYGLSIDSIVGFNLVLPNGTISYVTESTFPDLFFGLKGGFNNFGIVTDFTMTAFPQPEVWGGQIVYSPLQFDQARAAIANFSTYSQEPKAAILPSYVSFQGNAAISSGLFYDGPVLPPGVFDNFTNISSVSSDLKTRSYLDMILSAPANSTGGLRGSWQMVGVKDFSEAFLKTVEDELTYWSANLAAKDPNAVFTYSIEPFIPSYLSHANSPSAFPPPAARQLGKAPNPLLVYFAWTNPLYDKDFFAAIQKSAARLCAAAQAEGLLINNPLALYGNYVVADTPLVNIYGDNLPALRALRAKVDPQNVMGLTGGFKF